MAPHDLASLRSGLALGTLVVQLVWEGWSTRLPLHKTWVQCPSFLSTYDYNNWLGLRFSFIKKGLTEVDCVCVLKYMLGTEL